MGLTEVDPERYGSLSHPGDTFSYDIYSQAGAVARGVDGTVLAELSIERVIAIGESQSAFRLTTYVNAVDAVARGVTTASSCTRVVARARRSTRAVRSRDPSAPPERFRDDLRVPVLCFQAETDLIVLDYLPARQPDNEHFRLWEVAGTAHADVYTFVAGFVDSGALPIDASSRRVGADRRSPLGFELRPADQHRTAALRAPGCARALRPVGARRHAAAASRPGSRSSPATTATRSSSTSTATRAAGSARRTSTCRSRHCRVSATTAPPSRASAARPCRSARRSSRRSTRARPTTAPSSTPRPTPPSRPGSSSKPTRPRSRRSPPSASPPDDEPASPNQDRAGLLTQVAGSSGRRTWLCRGRRRGSCWMPVVASSVSKTSAKPAASRSSASASGRSKPASMTRLAIPIATTAPRPERRRPLERGVDAPPAGTTRSTRPSASASSAFTCRPLQIEILGCARARRAARAAACRPRPGRCRAGSRGSRAARRSPATRRSHASASSNPPPSAKPSIAAITGRGNRRRARRTRRGTRRVTRGAAPGSVNSDTSAPAASAFSLPVTTTAFTAASAASTLGDARRSRRAARSTAG